MDNFQSNDVKKDVLLLCINKDALDVLISHTL